MSSSSRKNDVEAGRSARNGERASLLAHPDSDDELIGAGGSRGHSNTQPTGPRVDEKVTGVQQQVHGVMQVMQDNINRILERGDRLDELEQRSDNLNVNADHFRRGATQVRRRMWWQNCRIKIIIGLAVLVILGIIITVAVVETAPKKQ